MKICQFCCSKGNLELKLNFMTLRWGRHENLTNLLFNRETEGKLELELELELKRELELVLKLYFMILRWGLHEILTNLLFKSKI